MGIVDPLYRRVQARRVDVLAHHLTLVSIIPPRSSVVDVGCGDAPLLTAIRRLRPDADLSGLNDLTQSTFPLPDRSVDVVLFVDVLHRTTDPMGLLREASRVMRRAVVIKDCTLDGFLAGPTLRFIDRMGNGEHAEALKRSYWTSVQWDRAIQDLGLRATVWKRALGLYPKPAHWLFERSLHFIGVLEQAD